MIFKHQDMTFHIIQIKTTRMTVRRQNAETFSVHGPKSMTQTALKKMIIRDFERFLDLPIPFDYEAYLGRDHVHLFGTWKSHPGDVLKILLMNEIERLEDYYSQSQDLIDLSDLKYECKVYSSKFGSCHPTRRIIRFNQMLVHYPKSCVAYIYAHEIAHLKEANHQAGFYDVLKTIHPTYQRDQKQIKKIHAQFLKGHYDFTSITD